MILIQNHAYDDLIAPINNLMTDIIKHISSKIITFSF